MVSGKHYLFLIGLILVILLVIPQAYAADIHTDNGQVNLLGDRYWGYHLSLPQGGGIKYEIKANTTMNVYFLDSENLTRYQNGQDFLYIEGGSALGTKHARVQYTVDESKGGEYYLIVESTNYQDASFTYNITYGKDVEVSLGDFLTGLPGFFGACNWTWIIAAVIWLIIVVWVYKDAKRRGKSGALWAFVTLILPLIGLLIWLIVRPRRRNTEYLPPPP